MDNMCISIFRLSFYPKEIKKCITAPGRSSDLLPCLNAFPFLPIGTVATEMFVQHVKGAYSSGNCCRFSRHSLLFYS